MFTTVHAAGGARSPAEAPDFLREQARRGAKAGFMAMFQYDDPYRRVRFFMNPREKAEPGRGLSWDPLEPRALLAGFPAHIIERMEEQREICIFRPRTGGVCARAPGESAQVRR